MDRRRSLLGVIERHFGAFRKSQRRTMAAFAWGLLMAGRLGLAPIARGMAVVWHDYSPKPNVGSYRAGDGGCDHAPPQDQAGLALGRPVYRSSAPQNHA